MQSWSVKTGPKPELDSGLLDSVSAVGVVLIDRHFKCSSNGKHDRNVFAVAV